MSFSSSRRVGRPSSTVLSASKIARQARRLLARDGNFTMGALARELRVAPSSLYNHFQSRDEVLGAVSDAVVSEIRVDSLREAVVVLAERELTVEAKTELWVSAFGAWGVSYRDAFSESAELVAALALTPVGWAPQTLRMYELVLEALAAFGCPQERALSVVEALEAFLLGSALDANAPDHVFDPAVAGGDYPRLQEAYRMLRGGAVAPAEDAFAVGLEAMLYGLARRVIS